MSDVVKIEGMSDCLRWCDAAPADMVKVAKKAMRAGGRAVTRKAKPQIDKRWHKLLKYKVTGGRNDKDLNCGIGLFNGHLQQGKQPRAGAPVDDWFKAYWKNYGTLTRRDPNHQFITPIRPANTDRARRRRNNIGQPHVNFFDRSLDGYETTFYKAFEETLTANIADVYDR